MQTTVFFTSGGYVQSKYFPDDEVMASLPDDMTMDEVIDELTNFQNVTRLHLETDEGKVFINPNNVTMVKIDWDE